MARGCACASAFARGPIQCAQPVHRDTVPSTWKRWSVLTCVAVSTKASKSLVCMVIAKPPMPETPATLSWVVPERCRNPIRNAARGAEPPGRAPRGRACVRRTHLSSGWPRSRRRAAGQWHAGPGNNGGPRRGGPDKKPGRLTLGPTPPKLETTLAPLVQICTPNSNS